MLTEHIEEGGESRYKITDIIGTAHAHTRPHTTQTHTGKKDGLGVENLSGSGMIAGETSQAYNDVFTINLVHYTHTPHTRPHTHSHHKRIMMCSPSTWNTIHTLLTPAHTLTHITSV